MWPNGVADNCGDLGPDGEQRRFRGCHTIPGERDDTLNHLGGRGVQQQLVHEAGPVGNRMGGHGVSSSRAARRGISSISRCTTLGADCSTSMAHRTGEVLVTSSAR